MQSYLSENWISYFFTIADTVAKQSKDPSTKVGCVVVNNDRRILATGYNGFPVGFRDLIERYHDRAFKLKHIVHAEANAVCQAASSGVSFKDAAIFVTLQPCIECSKLIIQSGIKSVHFLIDEEEEQRRLESLEKQNQKIADDWRLSKEDALKLLLESGVNVYGYVLLGPLVRHGVSIIRTLKYNLSATGEIVKER